MADEKGSSRDQLKVTDKRIFTPEGDIREEFRKEIKPADPNAAKPKPAPESRAEAAPPKPSAGGQRAAVPPGGERHRTLADKAQNPGTPFSNFVEPLIAQAYMSLGMLRNPYQPKPVIDSNAAREMIEILGLLQEKTAGNLTPDEEDFLTAHLGELKLAFVQRTKSL